MRLYTNSKGAWAGTQADARKEFGKDWREVDVPTDKQSLLDFLNFHAVGGNLKYIEVETDIPQLHQQSCSANRDVREAASLNRYDVADVVLNCPKQHLASALGAIITRLNDQLGEI